MFHIDTTQRGLTFLASITGLTLAILVGLGSYECSRLNTLATTMSLMQRQDMAKFDLLQTQLRSIRTDASARKDPYTGTQAAQADSTYRAIFTGLLVRIHRLETALVEKAILSKEALQE